MTLIDLIIQSYASILMAIGAIASVVFIIGMVFIIRSTRNLTQAQLTLNIPAQSRSLSPSDKLDLPDTAHDVSAISGEDPMATQLDLARAYIETGKKQFAKIILKSVIREGSPTHQEEAQRLLGSI